MAIAYSPARYLGQIGVYNLLTNTEEELGTISIDPGIMQKDDVLMFFVSHTGVTCSSTPAVTSGATTLKFGTLFTTTTSGAYQAFAKVGAPASSDTDDTVGEICGYGALTPTTVGARETQTTMPTGWTTGALTISLRGKTAAGTTGNIFMSVWLMTGEPSIISQDRAA